jgi:formamidopyrimidine-DNA glycosylase
VAEGHAVARWGDALRRLVGDTVRVIQTPPRWRERAEGLLGARLIGVVTHGKHLVLEFSNDWVIHTHRCSTAPGKFDRAANRCARPRRKLGTPCTAHSSRRSAFQTAATAAV